MWRLKTFNVDAIHLETKRHRSCHHRIGGIDVLKEVPLSYSTFKEGIIVQ